ncbi:hypothetical protein PYV02_10255 [Leifsonia sp. H3M29-4]|uniref:hypothetical protein n=1 Tax=Salinibacterium metalliresistens TaxID=3031321 RepID=UPI0023DA3D0E|nr:hypothetical protein [Salinibacterium metalliresistens]MDF1479463.1 hypothetical protein [Salinibacterium metalliresistens]
MHQLTAAILWLATEPTPAPEIDENLVTPGAIGFAVTLLIAVATIALVIDMVRRIRRVRYREQVRAEIEAERATAPED